MAAQQPDISAILAALSAQKPGGTPNNSNQGPTQPPLPPNFPGGSAAPSNPLANAGLPLPPPSSSGALDLSAIKPANSGSVNFAEAIAKAQAGAQRARDQYSNTRSRSRSPNRRENFRDNYNPYRDERRNDSRRDNRDRSHSPYRETFSPTNSNFNAGRTRSPNYGRRDDNDSEIITMDSGSVGLVIGRGGENLRRVEQETGARVQFITGPEGSGPRRQCRISGTARQRSDAKREIFRTIDENPNAGNRSNSQQQQQHHHQQQQHQQQQHQQQQHQQVPTRNSANSNNQPALREGENSLQIFVPDRTVGLIIGRGGETIRDLQDRSGCHINIVGENKSVNGMRPVNLIGTQPAADKAQAMIAEIVESDTRGQGLPQQQNQQPQQPQRNNDPYGGQDTYGRSSSTGGEGKVNDLVIVPSDAVGMIIGKGGETIKNMQSETSCKINVSPPSGADLQREIGLIGTRAAIEHAKRAIWDKVNAVREKQGQRREPMPGSHGTDPYTQQQQPSYGQPPAQSAPPVAPPAAGGGDPSADPFAPYGGYENYMALWTAALVNQQGNQGGA